jgi:hypothetical protein
LDDRADIVEAARNFGQRPRPLRWIGRGIVDRLDSLKEPGGERGHDLANSKILEHDPEKWIPVFG